MEEGGLLTISAIGSWSLRRQQSGLHDVKLNAVGTREHRVAMLRELVAGRRRRVGAHLTKSSGIPNSDGTKVLTPASFAASTSSSCQGKPAPEMTLTTVSMPAPDACIRSRNIITGFSSSAQHCTGAGCAAMQAAADMIHIRRAVELGRRCGWHETLTAMRSSRRHLAAAWRAPRVVCHR